MESLAHRYAKFPVEFILVYTREPHANEGIFRKMDQPADYPSRLKYAERTCSELVVQREVLIDTMDGEVQGLYGGLPNMLYIISPQGKIIYHNRWADASEAEATLRKVLNKK